MLATSWSKPTDGSYQGSCRVATTETKSYVVAESEAIKNRDKNSSFPIKIESQLRVQKQD